MDERELWSHLTGLPIESVEHDGDGVHLSVEGDGEQGVYEFNPRWQITGPGSFEIPDSGVGR